MHEDVNKKKHMFCIVFLLRIAYVSQDDMIELLFTL